MTASNLWLGQTPHSKILCFVAPEGSTYVHNICPRGRLLDRARLAHVHRPTTSWLHQRTTAADESGGVVVTVYAAPVALPGTTTRWSLNGTRGIGPSDGAWWPRSTDLATEIRDLDVAVFHLLHERIARVAYTQGKWAPAPRKIHTELGGTKIGWFAHARYPENIDLSLTGNTHLVLTVIPAGTDAHFARIVLAGYGTLVNPVPEVAEDPRAAEDETEVWDNEGGHAAGTGTTHYGRLFD